jgi:hypothetical protein
MPSNMPDSMSNSMSCHDRIQVLCVRTSRFMERRSHNHHQDTIQELTQIENEGAEGMQRLQGYTVPSALSSHVDNLGANQRILLKMIKSHNAQMDGLPNSQATEMQKIRSEFHNEVDNLRSKVTNRFDTSDSKMDQEFAQMMAAISTMLAVAAPVTTAPAQAPTTVPPCPARAQQQIQQQQQEQQIQQTQHIPNTSALSLPAPSATILPVPLLSTSSFPASTVAPIVMSVAAPISAEVKDNFKPTPRDKQNQNVFDLARQF